MIQHNRDNLQELLSLLNQLDDVSYTTALPVLSGASIGGHVRHILEFYVCLLRSVDQDNVCYDERDRNQRIETERTFAVKIAAMVMDKLSFLTEDRAIQLKSNFSMETKTVYYLNTSLYRELAYCLEHAIHHQAILKIALLHLQSSAIPSESFGVAPSTYRHYHS